MSHRTSGRRRAAAAGLLLALLVGASGRAAAADSREELARALAGVMLDEGSRREIDEQVTLGMIRTIGTTLEARLSRRLFDVEWRIVADIVKRFVAETAPSSHAQELAARIYARHFDEGELRELLRFHQSAVGQKAARLAPVIRTETAEAIDADLRESPAVSEMITALQREFPILTLPGNQSP